MMQRSSVVLPMPFVPTIATRCSASTCKLTSLNTLCSPKLLESLFMLTARRCSFFSCSNLM